MVDPSEDYHEECSQQQLKMHQDLIDQMNDNKKEELELLEKNQQLRLENERLKAHSYQLEIEIRNESKKFREMEKEMHQRKKEKKTLHEELDKALTECNQLSKMCTTAREQPIFGGTSIGKGIPDRSHEFSTRNHTRVSVSNGGADHLPAAGS